MKFGVFVSTRYGCVVDFLNIKNGHVIKKTLFFYLKNINNRKNNDYCMALEKKNLIQN
jgi:predicted transcriptional regulator